MQIKWMMIVLRLHFKWHMPTVFIPDSKIFSYVFWSQVLLFWKEFCNFFFIRCVHLPFWKAEWERERGRNLVFTDSFPNNSTAWACQVKIRRQKLHPGPPEDWPGLRFLDHHLPCSRLISRNLDWKVEQPGLQWHSIAA